ncbi:hypothetical protein RCO28_03180 [Streptomyces sp. LHD-70]|uniref:hypothetical protein n=1 Tax=Streptomyces sp. LHD-70 TaxID=3072140 RepID=UPI00280C7257|nr:hypothetical protein [Streptomyces sp. LHD-70]MDQ8701495.1 hypothetical protein [Streptomyces sp. LHD-70]
MPGGAPDEPDETHAAQETQSYEEREADEMNGPAIRIEVRGSRICLHAGRDPQADDWRAARRQ